MKYQRELKEAEQKLKNHPRQIPDDICYRYIGGRQSRLKFLGLKVPKIKQTLKKDLGFLNREPLIDIWDEIWNHTNYFEVMSLPLFWYYDKSQTQASFEHWKRLVSWSAKIDNWAHSDLLSGIYARILENEPKTLYPVLLKWSDSQNPWLRRQSIVSLLYYAHARDRVLPASKCFPLVKKQLSDDHYYVQKGVGWALRELSVVYPEKTKAFLLKHVGEVSSVAFTAAVEKIPKTFKEKLKRERKHLRSALRG